MEDVYEELRKHSLVKDQYQFSRLYLGQSKSYYSVCKARKRSLGTKALVRLGQRLEGMAQQFKQQRNYSLSESLQGAASVLEQLAERVWIRVKHTA